MKISDNGIKFIESNEGLKLEAYQDTGKVWTIGYGHTAGVKKGDVITQQQAEEFLRRDIRDAEITLNKFLDTHNISITTNAYDALIDFIFNVGANAFLKSTLARKLTEYDYDGASQQFGR